jgi:hypothetical protein
VRVRFCERERDLWDAIVSGRWPVDAEPCLRDHVASCASCRDLAIVATRLHAEAADAASDPPPPAAAIVWWRAQMRARQESARAVDRPIPITQALAIASGAGLLLGLAGSVAAWVRGSVDGLRGWPAGLTPLFSALPSVDLTSPLILAAIGMIAMTLVIAPLALYALRSDG